MTSVLIVDDHPVVREGLAGMLVSEKDFRIAGSCESGAEAERFCRKNGVCDVVLMDIRMPGQDGFETLDRLKNFFPRIKVLLLAGMPMKPEAEKAKEMGACGYLSKSAPQGTLIGAIRKIASGDATFIEDDASHQPGATGVLTFREVEILRYLADGKRREDIVDILGISLDTVRTHIKHIISKMGATNTPSAIARGYESGILK